MRERAPITPEVLLGHARFVRSLARQLVRDEHAAEDAEQETWLTALRHPPSTARGLRSWLRRVLQNIVFGAHRSVLRRTARERAAARSEVSRPADETAAREAMLLEVAIAVLDLEPNLRTIVLARFFEDLTLREIAERHQMPLPTVQSRLARALEELRHRLDRQHGENRDAWCAALLSLTGSSLEPVTLGALIMSLKLPLAAAAVILLASAWWLWPLDERAAVDAPRTTADPSTNVPVAGPLVANHRAQVVAESAAEPPQVQVGSVRVRVTRSDGSPARGFGLWLARVGSKNPYPDARQGFTDDAGCLLWDDLIPGRWRAVLDRAGSIEGSVRAGERTEIALELPAGVEVRGVVVDLAQRPIAGAEIWLSDEIGPYSLLAQRVAHSAGDGTFVVRDVERNRYVWARASGYAPSRSHRVRGVPGEATPITLEMPGRGGVVHGTVVDPAGRAVAGAHVLVGFAFTGDTESLPDGTELEGTPPHWLVTSKTGEFIATGVPLAACSVIVCATDFVPWFEQVELRADETLEKLITLDLGATVTGTVSDTDSSAASEVVVTACPTRAGAHMQDPTFVTHTARTLADGSYALRGLARDAVQLRADGGARGDATLELQHIAGDRVRWDPSLARGSEIRGTLVTEANVPLANWSLEASGSSHVSESATDAQGRFAFVRCDDSRYRVAAFEPSGSVRYRGDRYPCAWIDAVAAGTTDLVIRVSDERRSSARFRGSVLSPEGAPIAGADLDLVQLATGATITSWGSPFASASTGAFEIGPLPPAQYRLKVRAPGFPSMTAGTFTLARGQTLDLGALRLTRPATLVVSATRSDEQPIVGLGMSIWDARDRGTSVAITGQIGRSQPLAPGSYTLRCWAKRLAQVQIPFEIHDGQERRLEITLVPGVKRFLRCLWPADHGQDSSGAPAMRSGCDAPYAWVRISVRDAAGGVIASGLFPNDMVPSFTLAPARYTIAAETDTGLRATQTLDVVEIPLDAEEARAVDLDGDPRVVQLPLR